MLLGLTITCLLFPALTVPFSLLGYISKNKVQRVLGLFFLALFMGLMAMCFRDPKTDPDIVRYIAAVKDYANVSFFRAFNHAHMKIYMSLTFGSGSLPRRGIIS